MRRTLIAGFVACALVAAAIAPATAASAPAPASAASVFSPVGEFRELAVRAVGVVDNRFTSPTLNARRGDIVRWVFPRRNVNFHNVIATKTPRGVPKRRYRSSRAVGPGSAFARRVKRPGVYRFFCSIHPFMRMQVNVRR